jgi:hypothetical protein
MRYRFKVPKNRDLAALALIERQGAGAGFHSKRKYTRLKKHKKRDYDDE